jgi:hypothetical protein
MDSGDAFEALIEKVSARGDTYGYFFERLNDPKWLAPLADRGFFKEPLGIEQLDNGFVRFPVWPESRALARLAEAAETDVVKLILACPETDNPRVHDDFVDAANSMSPRTAALLVPSIIGWFRGSYKLLLPLKAGELLERLAKGGEVEASMTLARTLLQLSEREPVPLANDDLFGSRREVAPLFDQYEYKTILENNVPGFVLATGLRGLALLCDHLEQALLVEGAKLGGPPADASYIWRPSIADHEQNHDWDPHDFLVTSIREAADSLVSRGDATLAEVSDLLSSRGWQVFDRLAMHLAAKWIGMDPRPAIVLMQRRDLFDSYEVSHEYGGLVAAAFESSAIPEQLQWLVWVEEGPNPSQYAERVAAETGLPPSPDVLRERADRWRLERLAYVPDDALSSEWAERKQELSRQFGEPSDFPFQMYTPPGSVSPVTMERAAELSPQELAELAADIPMSADRLSSPEEGYASVLQALAEQQPSKMSSGLNAFLGQRPVYVRSIMSGLERAANANAADIDWASVVSMSEWVMAQPRDIPGGSGGTYSDLDPGWVWTRTAVADLLEQGLRLQTIPLNLRERVWAVLVGLLGDPDAGGSASLDAATDSLNHIRGKAMHDVFLYANWVFQAANKSGQEEPVHTLQALMPEVAQELDSHLDSSVEPSPAVRAVYGMRFRLLTFLDRDWAESHVGRIFSTHSEDGFDALGAAAWDSYVKYGRANLGVMELLRPQYETFVRSLTPEGSNLDDDQRFVADHIMVLYWNGRLGEEPDTDALLNSFFENGSASVRRRALEFVGRNLRDSGSDLAPEITQRLRLLWEYRLAIAQTAPASERAEIEAFGWWMESQALEADWRLRQLLEVLRLVNVIDVDYLVVRALAELDDAYLEDALRSLVQVIRADTDGWGVHGWKDPAYQLIQRGTASGDQGSKQLANDAANLLIARGFHEFRSLVSAED